MHFDQEQDSHELFIRTTTVMHPNAPLRLNANVLGKLCVDPKLSENTSTHLRNIAAAEQEVESTRRYRVPVSHRLPECHRLPVFQLRQCQSTAYG